MATRDDGGLAFPDHDEMNGSSSGMSLRDYFAAKAMQGLFAGNSVALPFTEGHDLGFETAAMRAYRMADAMLAERAK